MVKDNRSKKFIFIPFCLICQGFQAKGIVKYKWAGSITPLIEELVKRDVNIIQMPCPESQLGGYESGLKREPHGYAYYDTKEFRSLCEESATETVEKIKALIKNDYEVLTVLGIEMSPSCAVSYQYSNKGMVRKSGIFIEILKEKLSEENISIKFIGVNRKFVDKSLREIKKLFD
jgi:predicted secreted protein